MRDNQQRVLLYLAELFDVGVPPSCLSKIAADAGLTNDGPLCCPRCCVFDEVEITLIGMLSDGLDIANRCTCTKCGYKTNVFRFRLQGELQATRNADLKRAVDHLLMESDDE